MKSPCTPPRKGDFPTVPLDYLTAYLQEDAPSGDITSSALFQHELCTGVIHVHQDGVAAGLSEAAALFQHGGGSVECLKQDGDMVKSGQDLMRISGEARWILLAERTALNIIGRMSGIATTTRKLVETVNQVNQSCRVAATRKTAPGMRLLDKKAVIIGGGDPHRLGLSDGFLVKDNHLALISIEEAISRLLKRSVTKKIEIEVADRESALRAISAGADIVMFDNMNAEEVRSAIRFLEERGLRKEVIIEVSGGITGSNIAAYASCGVDLISVGGLTHSVRNLDVSLEIIPGLV